MGKIDKYTEQQNKYYACVHCGQPLQEFIFSTKNDLNLDMYTEIRVCLLKSCIRWGLLTLPKGQLDEPE